jgi:hypothetical protein
MTGPVGSFAKWATYSEAYDRNLGASSVIERSQANLWNPGGLQFVPPIR